MPRRKAKRRQKKTASQFITFKMTRKSREKILPAFIAILALAGFLYLLSKFHPGMPPPASPKAKAKAKSLFTPSKPKSLLYRPQAERRLAPGPKITFVIDDMGHTAENTKALRALGDRVTYSILPFLKHSRELDALSTQTGAEVILHLPLESLKGTIPGPGLITTQMKNDEVLEHVSLNLKSVPHALGANNHMGSKGTSDPRLMHVILKEFKRRNLFFLDSRTTAGSVVKPVAASFGTPFLKRDVFLDNEDKPEAIRAQIRRTAEIARLNGSAIAIGHYRTNTLQVLREEIPQLEREGFQIVSLKDLVENR